MAAPRKQRCRQGHDDWTVDAAGSRRCRVCRRNEVRRRHRKQAENAIALSVGAQGGAPRVRIPWAPLQEAFTDRGENIENWVNSRTVARWKRQGWVSLVAADEVCCRALAVHPVAVYGPDWYDFGSELSA